MVQSSLIDSEYKGVSTIEIMKYLSPDVVTLGNHELDYGLPHLLFLEKIANFPIVNANLYIKQYGKRLMDALALDQLIGTFVSTEDAAEEIRKICNAYKNNDIDLTIALTHIGFESDVELAKMLKPEWGVDMILGGHSHTVLEQPEVVNNILIGQQGIK
jgi:5'-nucleotidase/UDP-sugar diphosphatase